MCLVDVLVLLQRPLPAPPRMDRHNHPSRQSSLPSSLIPHLYSAPRDSGTRTTLEPPAYDRDGRWREGEPGPSSLLRADPFARQDPYWPPPQCVFSVLSTPLCEHAHPKYSCPLLFLFLAPHFPESASSPASRPEFRSSFFIILF